MSERSGPTNNGSAKTKEEIKKEIIEERIPKTLIEKLDFIDRKLSGYVHSCVVKPRLLELIIFPFAVIFQPFMVPIVLASIGLFMPVLEDS